MTLWFVFALMTVAAIFAVLWPFRRKGQPAEGGTEFAVYADQLAEIDRDVAAGLIGAPEAEAARVEIGRRLLAAADGGRAAPAQSNLRLRRASAILALIALPIAAVTFYLSLGSPQLGDFPLASRSRVADANQPLDNLVAQVEAHLEKNGRPMAAAGTCWRRCWHGSVATTRQSGPSAIRSPTTATAPSGGPTSARP